MGPMVVPLGSAASTLKPRMSLRRKAPLRGSYALEAVNCTEHYTVFMPVQPDRKVDKAMKGTVELI